MRPAPNYAAIAALLVCITLGAWQGQRVQHLRKSQAFYSWIIAAATNDRLFSTWDDNYDDKKLFDEIVKIADPLLPEPGETSQQNADATKLALLSGETDDDGVAVHNQVIWNIASGSDLQAQRKDFFTLGRERQLLFAQDIQYKDAVEGGVNIFNLFFGFRKVAANFIWIEVDSYWHKGYMHRMIPLMKTCVTLDPQFVDAYMLGAWHLAYNVTAQIPETPAHLKTWDEKHEACVGEKEGFYYFAADFLQDGIRNNPRNYKIYFDLGFGIYKQKIKDYGKAVFYIGEAMRQPHDVWVPRQLYVTQELNGQYAEALAGWKDYQKRFSTRSSGTDTAPRFILRNEGLIYEQQAQEAKDAADAATDPPEKNTLLTNYNSNLKKARDKWTAMQDDPFAQGRLLRLDALDLIRQERLIEALATLDRARWVSATFFEEASEIMINLKREMGRNLTVSERKWVFLQENADDCIGKPQLPLSL